MLAAWVSMATASESAAATIEKPPSWSPRLKPPAPENRSMAQGLGRSLSQRWTELGSLWSGDPRCPFQCKPHTATGWQSMPISLVSLIESMWLDYPV